MMFWPLSQRRDSGPTLYERQNIPGNATVQLAEQRRIARERMYEVFIIPITTRRAGGR